MVFTPPSVQWSLHPLLAPPFVGGEQPPLSGDRNPRLSGESNVASNSDIGFPFGRLPSVQSLSPLSAIAIAFYARQPAIAFYARQPAKPSVLLLK